MIERALTDRARLVHGIIVVVAFALLRLAARWFPPGALGIALAALAAGGFFAGIFYFGLLRLGGVGLRDLGWTWAGAPLDFVRGLGGTAVLMVALIALASLFYPPAAETARALWDAVAERSWAQRAQLLAVGALASFVEESLFRGYLQPPALRHFGEARGVVFTAVVFAAAHFEWAPPRWTALLLQGVGFGLLRGRRHTLWAPATAHSLLWALMP